MTQALERIRHAGLRSKIMSAEQAAEMVQHNMLVGMSGFTGAGYPKALPAAIAERARAAHKAGKPFQISLITGASTAPECDGVLAEAGCLKFRSPFITDPMLRNTINAGETAYTDIHLSHIEQQVRFGFFGEMNVAVIEVVGITEEGRLIPSMCVGVNNQWVKSAKKVILEINTRQNARLELMHDVFPDIGTPPHRKILPLTQADERIGSPYIDCDLDKIAAIVFTDAGDRVNKFAQPDENSKRIADQIIEFFEHEVKQGRLPHNLLPLQSGVGNVANAVLAGLQDSPFDHLTGFTEVMQDGMLDLILSGKMQAASATALSFSPEALQRFNDNIDMLHKKIVLRPPPRRYRHERHDRSRYLRQCQFHPCHGNPHDERHRRFGRFYPQRVLFVLRVAFGCQKRLDFLHRADGFTPRPHRTRRNVRCNRARHGRPARQIPPPARPPDY